MCVLLVGCGGSDNDGNSQPQTLTIEALYTTIPDGLDQKITVISEVDGVHEDVSERSELELSVTDGGEGGITFSGNKMTAVEPGSYTIQAAFGSTGFASVDVEVVDGTYQGLVLRAPEYGTTIPVNYSGQFRAEAVFELVESGARAYYDVTDVADWSATTGGVAASAPGFVTALSEEAGTVVASYQSALANADSNEATLAVSAVGIKEVSGLTVEKTRNSDAFVVGFSTPVRAVLAYTDNVDQL